MFLRESEFITQLRHLLSRRVRGLDDARKREIVERLVGESDLMGGERMMPECHFVPFVTGRRPTDEAAFPGLGSSDHVGFLLEGAAAAGNTAYLLYRIRHLGAHSEGDVRHFEVRATLSFSGPRGDVNAPALPAWASRVVEPLKFGRNADGAIRLVAASLLEAEDTTFVLPLNPEQEFLPGHGWEWSDLDPLLREPATDAEDPFTFGHLFLQQIHAQIILLRDGLPISGSETYLDLCDGRRFGSLYQRVIERVIKPDTAAQAKAAGISSLDHAYHPWYPVLHIGSDKAELYTRALVEDIVHKRHHFTDPRWLLRVGLYLEFLTCLGIVEAVRDDLGDLLTPAERRIYEEHEWFAPIRAAVDVDAWRAVWRMRQIVLPQIGAPRAGSVSTTNLLAKKRATLAFLETHHEDLKRAIAFAGPNDFNAQETWHRVFRDAERAVLRKTPSAFPELSALPPKAQEFILWHQKGDLGLKLPAALSGWFGDQDGLYASACNQYRASMNHVATWARRVGLMDYAGKECVPEEVSLLRAFMQAKHIRLGQLQRRDGYAGTIDVSADLPQDLELDLAKVVELLRSVQVFRTLTDGEVLELANSVRPIELGPVERIIVQGRPGSSLFVLAEGSLEVLVRHEDGTDVPVAMLDPGAVFGEMSVLTGEPRSATVRSVDPALVYEIGHRELGAIVHARPAAVDELASLMEPRLRANARDLHAYEARQQIASLRERIRVFLLGK